MKEHKIQTNIDYRQYDFIDSRLCEKLLDQGNEYTALENNLNEDRIAEMSDGTLVVNARSLDQHRYNVVSMDGRASWSDSTLW